MGWRSAFRDQRRRWGWARAVRWLAMVALERYAGLRLYAMQVRALREEEQVPALPPELSMRIADRRDLLDASHDPSLELDPGMVEAALGRGDLCVGAFERDRLVAYVWRAFGPTPTEDALWIHFERPHRYGYKAFTRPEYRGRHLQHPLSLATDRLCRERGFTHALSYVAVHNYPSLASNAHRANETVGYAGYVRWLGWRVPFRSPGVKRLGVRFSSRGRNPQ